MKSVLLNVLLPLFGTIVIVSFAEAQTDVAEAQTDIADSPKAEAIFKDGLAQQVPAFKDDSQVDQRIFMG